jgi:hypothetical protein
MGDMGGTPKNSIAMLGGDGPFGYIPMGGMFTVIKVRESLTSYEDPGWYEHPEGAVADAAAPEDLRRDGVDPDAPVESPEDGSEHAPSAPPPPGPGGGHPGHGGHGSR